MRIRPHLWAAGIVLLAPLAALASGAGGICNPAPAINGMGAPMVCAGCHGAPVPGVKACLKRTDASTLTVSVTGGGVAGFNLTVIGGELTITDAAHSKLCAGTNNEATHTAPTAGTWTIGYSGTPGQPALFFLAGNAGPMAGNKWTLAAGAVPEETGATTCSVP